MKKYIIQKIIVYIVVLGLAIFGLTIRKKIEVGYVNRDGEFVMGLIEQSNMNKEIILQNMAGFGFSLDESNNTSYKSFSRNDEVKSIIKLHIEFDKKTPNVKDFISSIYCERDMHFESLYALCSVFDGECDLREQQRDIEDAVELAFQESSSVNINGENYSATIQPISGNKAYLFQYRMKK